MTVPPLTRRAIVFLSACLMAGSGNAQDSRPRPERTEEILRAVDVLDSLTGAEWTFIDADLRARKERFEKEARRLEGLAEETGRKAVMARRAAANIEKILDRFAKLRPTELAPVVAAETRKATPESKESASKPASSPTVVVSSAPGVEPAALPDYEDHIRPIFENACFACHRGDAPDGGLDLGEYRLVMKGGASGVVVKAGSPRESRLFRMVAHLESPFMPKDASPLSEDETKEIEAWIAAGAPENSRTAAARPVVVPAAELPAPATSAPNSAPLAGRSDRPARATPHHLVHTSLSAEEHVVLAARDQLMTLDKDGIFRDLDLKIPWNRVEALALDRSGRTLLAAGGTPGQKGGAILFDLSGTDQPRVLMERGDSVLAAALSPRGLLAAIGGTDPLVRVILTSTGQTLYTLQDAKDWVLTLAFSPDGNYLAVGDRSGVLNIYHADTGRPHLNLRGHDGAVRAALFAPDAGLLASVGDDGFLHIFELNDGREFVRVNTTERDLESLAWVNEKLVVVGGVSGIVRFYNSDGGPAGVSAALGDWIYSLSGVGNDRVLATTADRKLFWIDVKTKQVQLIPGGISKGADTSGSPVDSASRQP